jgi:DNA transposition AAA+ family ATPase
MKTGCIGLIIAESGIGKTMCADAVRLAYPSAVYVPCDITTQGVSMTLKHLGRRLGCTPRSATVSALLQTIIERLRGSGRLVIFDDAHFLKWEAFEAVRAINDGARVGILLLGQERLYSRMRGESSSYLYDQLYSRIGIRREIRTITRGDVRAVCDSIAPGLDKLSIDFLLDRALGKGHYRSMIYLLRLAAQIAKENNLPLNLERLHEAGEFLMI